MELLHYHATARHMKTIPPEWRDFTQKLTNLRICKTQHLCTSPTNDGLILFRRTFKLRLAKVFIKVRLYTEKMPNANALPIPSDVTHIIPNEQYHLCRFRKIGKTATKSFQVLWRLSFILRVYILK